MSIRLPRRLRYNYRLYLENPELVELGLPQRRRPITAEQIAKKFPFRLRQLLDEAPAPLEKQIEYSWDPKAISLNMQVKDDQITVKRTHIMNSTDGVRGKIGFAEGLHVWEVHWPLCKRGTHATVGVVTAGAPLHHARYCDLIGFGMESWGWDILHCKTIHNVSNNPQKITYPEYDDTKDMYRVPSTFFIVLDMDAGTLSFIAEGQYLGVAFEGLKGKTLYPAIGCVWGDCEIALKYIGGLNSDVAPLKEMCRRFIRENAENLTEEVNAMSIPEELKAYILYQTPNSAYNTRVLTPSTDSSDYVVDSSSDEEDDRAGRRLQGNDVARIEMRQPVPDVSEADYLDDDNEDEVLGELIRPLPELNEEGDEN